MVIQISIYILTITDGKVSIKEMLMMILTLNMEKEQRLLVDAVPLSRENFGISVAVVMAIVKQVKLSVVSLSDKRNWFSISRKDPAIHSPSLSLVFSCALAMESHATNVIREFQNAR